MATLKWYLLLINLVGLNFQSEAQETPHQLYGGEVIFPKIQCVTDSMLTIVTTRVQNNIKQLESEGKITQKLHQEADILFDWPLRLAPGFPSLPYHVTGTNFDVNPLYNQLSDYMCGRRTYDGHNGTDMGLWPFSWKKMDDGAVDVVAAADGIIVEKHDGDFDRNCGESSTSGNYVILLHSDGTKTHYWHMKKGSVVAEAIGTKVLSGGYLGKVGSSGNSSGPHLHFVVQKPDGSFIDPASGSCNNLTSRWMKQRPYYEPTLHLIATHKYDQGPAFPDCPASEPANIKTSFQSGELVLFSAFFHDQLSRDVVQYQILKPDNTVHVKWTQTMKDTLSVSYWVAAWFLPNPAPAGVWRYEATYRGVTMSTSFSVDVVNGVDANLPVLVQLLASPNPVSGTVVLSNLDLGKTIVVKNIFGQTVITGLAIAQDQPLDLSALKSGIYFIINGNRIVKIIKT